MLWIIRAAASFIQMVNEQLKYPYAPNAPKTNSHLGMKIHSLKFIYKMQLSIMILNELRFLYNSVNKLLFVSL